VIRSLSSASTTEGITHSYSLAFLIAASLAALRKRPPFKEVAINALKDFVVATLIFLSAINSCLVFGGTAAPDAFVAKPMLRHQSRLTVTGPQKQFKFVQVNWVSRSDTPHRNIKNGASHTDSTLQHRLQIRAASRAGIVRVALDLLVQTSCGSVLCEGKSEYAVLHCKCLLVTQSRPRRPYIRTNILALLQSHWRGGLGCAAGSPTSATIPDRHLRSDELFGLRSLEKAAL